MAYNLELDARISASVTDRRWERKKMVGGTCYLLHGNMFSGVWRDFPNLRCGPERFAELISRPEIRAFDVTGRVMKGWIMAPLSAVGPDAELNAWIEFDRRFAETLPRKR